MLKRWHFVGSFDMRNALKTFFLHRKQSAGIERTHKSPNKSKITFKQKRLRNEGDGTSSPLFSVIIAENEITLLPFLTSTNFGHSLNVKSRNRFFSCRISLAPIQFNQRDETN